MWQSDLHWAVEIARRNLVVNERLLPQGGSLLFYSENWRKCETDRTDKGGIGDTFDESKMITYGSGCFRYLDPGMHHYCNGTW